MISNKKYGELQSLLDENPWNFEKLNKYFNRLDSKDKEELVKIINQSNMEKLELIKEANELVVLREEALNNMRTWTRWGKSVKKMRPTAFMVSIITLYIAAKGFQSPIWTESILKSGVVLYGGLWLWQKFIELAIRGAKESVNKRRRRLIKMTADFFRKYGLTDDGKIPIIPRLNRRDAK